MSPEIYFAKYGCLPRGCGRMKPPCVDLVSSQTAMLSKAANRTAYYNASDLPTLASLATTAPFAVMAGFTDTLATNGQWRTIYITDLVGTGLPAAEGLDALLFTVSVGGHVRMTFMGGRFNRTNANAATGACNIEVCAGPVETVVVTATNITNAALGAAAGVRLETRTVYSGEPGFTCKDSCTTPPPCDEGDEEEVE